MEIVPKPHPRPFAAAADQLGFELGRLEVMLERQVLRLRAANLLTEDPFRGLYVADAQVDALLRSGVGIPVPSGEPSVEALGRKLAQLDDERRERIAASRRAGTVLPFPRLAEIFGLDPLELDLLLIALAPELDGRYEPLYAYVQNDATRRRPAVGLALELLAGSFEEKLERRAHLAAGAPLRRHRLLRLVDDPQDREPPLPSRILKVEERIADFLAGGDRLAAELLPFTERVVPRDGAGGAAAAPAVDGTLLREIHRTVAPEGAAGGAGATVVLRGGYGTGKRGVAEAVCATLGVPLLVVDLERVVAAEAPLAPVLALLRREALLRGAALHLDRFEVVLAEEARKAARLATLAGELAELPLPLFLATTVPWEAAGLWGERPFLAFELPRPSYRRRLELWRQALDGARARLAPDSDAGAVTEAVAGKFVLSAGQIRDAARRAAHLAASRGTAGVTAEELHAAARAQSNPGLARLASKVEPVYRWDDIVLPRRSLQQLREVDASVRYRHRVYSEWGFERKLALGRGLNVLFSGPSGTGKTMAASILARELGLDLYKIDLSAVVSKYIGDTEKNLDRIFREAHSSNAILFFDEADALFGKRSEVRDAHDRYANIEVAYLLQKMEEYDGVVILATNLKKNLDEAFARRMHHTVELPFPEAADRERIFRRVFPPEAPLAGDVDFHFLAERFKLAGGNIRNVALTAAFLAAEAGEAITMERLVVAVARELQKMGRLATKGEFREYYELIRERG